VVITTRGKMVFVAESFPLPLARKLARLIFDAQGTGALRIANLGRTDENSGQPAAPLTGDLVRFFENCGVMKAAVDAGIRATR
jgi:hypothetical protein